MASTQTEAPTLPDRAAARGWLVRPAPGDDERGDAEPATSVLLDLRRPAHVVLTVGGASGALETPLRPGTPRSAMPAPPIASQEHNRLTSKALLTVARARCSAQ
jgi:hypothetical protein